MILRTNLPEKRIGGIQAFAITVLRLLREGMEARAGAIRGERVSDRQGCR